MLSYTPAHERANVISHLIGFCFGLIAIPLLLFRVGTADGSTGSMFMAVLVYGVSYLMVFGFSTLYHFQGEPTRKRVMKIWDHISIYYLIAGTFTPFLVAYATDKDAVLMLWVLWLLALAGTVFKVFFTGRFRIVSTLIYLGMGYLIFAAPDSFLEAMSDDSVFWIGLGGVFYTGGVLFYLVRKIPFHHAIWHIFVLAGAVSHFIGIWRLSG